MVLEERGLWVTGLNLERVKPRCELCIGLQNRRLCISVHTMPLATTKAAHQFTLYFKAGL